MSVRTVQPTVSESFLRNAQFNCSIGSPTENRIGGLRKYHSCGPDTTKEVFIAEPAYDTDSMWQWQNQGSLKGFERHCLRPRASLQRIAAGMAETAVYPAITPPVGLPLTTACVFCRTVSRSTSAFAS